ncbi:MAG: alcohol dehydrogenase catalytic domain-containing protein [Acidobacteriota bacterium]
MRALTFHDVGDVHCETVPDPELRGDDEAIVRVTRTAICGSDLHVYRGGETGLDAGTILGHEFVGEIVELGPAVQGLSQGDLVVSPFSTSCGACFYCTNELPSRCEKGELYGWVEQGEGLHGAQAELVRVPLASSTLVRVPDDLDPGLALLTGDVLATGTFCAELAGVGPGMTVAVLGCGPVGLLAVLASCRRQADRVLAVDDVPERLALAERFGAEPVDRSAVDPIEHAQGLTAGRGVDAVLECVGSEGATRLGVDLVRPGGTLAAVGVHVEAGFAFSPGEAYDKNLTYRAGRCPARRHVEQLLPVVRERADDLRALLTHELPLSDGVGAYEMFDQRRDGCIKVMLDPDA